MALLDVYATNILVIDDDEDVRKLFRMWLEQAGYSVFDAPDGMRAADICRLTECSLVICDLFMEHKDGLETIQELRTHFPSVKLIAISGGGTTGDLDFLPVAKALGALESLSKPIDRTHLLESVSRVLATSGG